MYRYAVGTALATGLILVWLIGAVGVIGAEGNPADRMYAAVFAVGIIGAIIARLRPLGMARAMTATACAQAIVVVVALISGEQHAEFTSVFEITALNGFFVGLWLLSAWLFGRAGRGH